MNENELKKVLENHKHWLNNDCDGFQNMKADLRCANLEIAYLGNADLRCADLMNTNLRGAYLRGADLRGAYLRGADLRGACLIGADLTCANLRGADLTCANLRGADLTGANLKNANLRCADLTGANLKNANLRRADLTGANLTGADLRYAKNIPFIPYTCPDTSSFIGYKKANGYIVELEILADAKRCSATGRKCRCNKAKVLQILDTSKNRVELMSIASDYDENFIYRVGEIVEEPNFCEDRWNECSAGIHFFINFQEAVNY